MRKLLATVIILLGAPLPGAGQETPRFELYAGYSAMRSNEPPGQCGCFILHGGSGAAAYNFNRWVGALAQFDAGHAGNINATGNDLTLSTYLFGLQISYRKHEKFRPYAHFLIGGAHSGGSLISGGAGASASSNTSGLKLGGGLDWTVHRHAAVRLLQLEYLHTGFPNSINARQNNFQMGAGVVLRFGKAAH